MAERFVIDRLRAAQVGRRAATEAIAELLYENGVMLADSECGAPLLWAEMVASPELHDRVEVARHRDIADTVMSLDVDARTKLVTLIAEAPHG
ncbi:hypothetical protein NFI95_05870 [Acetobacteraceae bacterium KSS8]|uniref:Uncharacterized protein n=1 Tax=Endosaccharibacter trunci TaxID=2812733 RepID=A0ABT1W524_9PROT|nr:hypothetical protein [Acetobacteraceae bacterium KSS8]